MGSQNCVHIPRNDQMFVSFYEEFDELTSGGTADFKQTKFVDAMKSLLKERNRDDIKIKVYSEKEHMNKARMLEIVHLISNSEFNQTLPVEITPESIVLIDNYQGNIDDVEKVGYKGIKIEDSCKKYGFVSTFNEIATIVSSQ